MARSFQPVQLDRSLDKYGTTSKPGLFSFIDEDTGLLIYFVGVASVLAYFVGRLFR
tara:strand:- start:941 stop:1108 length:168 start_codon:yes stop_codon:yes gene_type:complete